LVIIVATENHHVRIDLDNGALVPGRERAVWPNDLPLLAACQVQPLDLGNWIASCFEASKHVHSHIFFTYDAPTVISPCNIQRREWIPFILSYRIQLTAVRIVVVDDTTGSHYELFADRDEGMARVTVGRRRSLNNFHLVMARRHNLVQVLPVPASPTRDEQAVVEGLTVGGTNGVQVTETLDSEALDFFRCPVDAVH